MVPTLMTLESVGQRADSALPQVGLLPAHEGAHGGQIRAPALGLLDQVVHAPVEDVHGHVVHRGHVERRIGGPSDGGGERAPGRVDIALIALEGQARLRHVGLGLVQVGDGGDAREAADLDRLEARLRLLEGGPRRDDLRLRPDVGVIGARHVPRDVLDDLAVVPVGADERLLRAVRAASAAAEVQEQVAQREIGEARDDLVLRAAAHDDRRAPWSRRLLPRLTSPCAPIVTAG